MSDAYIYKPEQITITARISENWVVSHYGFPDIPSFIDQCIESPRSALAVLQRKYRNPIICCYPEDVAIPEED